MDRFAQLPSGVRLCYRDVGYGAPILLVMGLGFQLIHWPQSLIDALERGGHRVIIFDNRDAGRSSTMTGATPTLKQKLLRQAPAGAYDLDDMADDAFGLLDHLGLEAAHVVGMSLGGMIAQVMAVSRPDRVQTLTSVFSTTGARNVGQPGLLIGGRRYRPDPDEARTLFEHSWERGGPNMHERTARQMAAIFASGDRSADLERITTPTLVIHGDRDPMVAPSGGRATARAIPGARRVTIEGMGHELVPTLTPRLAELILDHIQPCEERAA